MSRIFKSVCLRDTPMIIEHLPLTPPCEEEPSDPADAECDGPPEDEEVLPATPSEADVILAAARGEADAIIAAAEEQVEELRRQAYDEGYRKGYDDGVPQGEAAGLAQTRETIEAAVGRAQAIITTAEDQATQSLQAAERELVEMALAIARKILAREIADNPTVTLPIVRSALEKVHDQEQITVRVHPENYDFILAARSELQASLTRDNAMKVVADTSLKEGDCVVETSYGTLDARIDTQFELVKSALRELMP